jgi:nucleotide-binding universal stress UspA family protein
MNRRILVPLDGSSGSEAALDYVVDLSRAEGAALRLLHVAPPPRSLLGGEGDVVAYADQVAARLAEEARAWLGAVAARLAGQGCDVEVVVRFGDPVEEILEEATASGALLVAMASHRRRGVRRVVEGSVAERVERRSRVPVLVLVHGDAVPLRVEVAAAASSSAGGRLVRRHFWCAWSRRDVEVEFVEHGLPGLPYSVSIRACTAFEPPTAVQCHRRCVDSTFRRQWEPALPVHDWQPTAAGG